MENLSESSVAQITERVDDVRLLELSASDSHSSSDSDSEEKSPMNEYLPRELLTKIMEFDENPFRFFFICREWRKVAQQCAATIYSGLTLEIRISEAKSRRPSDRVHSTASFKVAADYCRVEFIDNDILKPVADPSTADCDAVVAQFQMHLHTSKIPSLRDGILRVDDTALHCCLDLTHSGHTEETERSSAIAAIDLDSKRRTLPLKALKGMHKWDLADFSNLVLPPLHLCSKVHIVVCSTLESESVQSRLLLTFQFLFAYFSRFPLPTSSSASVVKRRRDLVIENRGFKRLPRLSPTFALRLPTVFGRNLLPQVTGVALVNHLSPIFVTHCLNPTALFALRSGSKAHASATVIESKIADGSDAKMRRTLPKAMETTIGSNLRRLCLFRLRMHGSISTRQLFAALPPVCEELVIAECSDWKLPSKCGSSEVATESTLSECVIPCTLRRFSLSVLDIVSTDEFDANFGCTFVMSEPLSDDYKLDYFCIAVCCELLLPLWRSRLHLRSDRAFVHLDTCAVGIRSLAAGILESDPFVQCLNNLLMDRQMIADWNQALAEESDSDDAADILLPLTLESKSLATANSETMREALCSGRLLLGLAPELLSSLNAYLNDREFDYYGCKWPHVAPNTTFVEDGQIDPYLF